MLAWFTFAMSSAVFAKRLNRTKETMNTEYGRSYNHYQAIPLTSELRSEVRSCVQRAMMGLEYDVEKLIRDLDKYVTWRAANKLRKP